MVYPRSNRYSSRRRNRESARTKTAGFTRYWEVEAEFTDEEWEEIKNGTRRIISAVESDGISIAGPHGEGQPEITDEMIALNGDKSEGEWHETFLLERDPHSAFCKTARKPYDRAVKSILHLADKVGGFKIQVNADGETDWDRVRVSSRRSAHRRRSSRQTGGRTTRTSNRTTARLSRQQTRSPRKYRHQTRPARSKQAGPEGKYLYDHMQDWIHHVVDLVGERLQNQVRNPSELLEQEGNKNIAIADGQAAEMYVEDGYPGKLTVEFFNPRDEIEFVDKKPQTIADAVAEKILQDSDLPPSLLR